MASGFITASGSDSQGIARSIYTDEHTARTAPILLAFCPIGSHSIKCFLTSAAIRNSSCDSSPYREILRLRCPRNNGLCCSDGDRRGFTDLTAQPKGSRASPHPVVSRTATGHCKL